MGVWVRQRDAPVVRVANTRLHVDSSPVSLGGSVDTQLNSVATETESNFDLGPEAHTSLPNFLIFLTNLTDTEISGTTTGKLKRLTLELERR